MQYQQSECSLICLIYWYSLCIPIYNAYANLCYFVSCDRSKRTKWVSHIGNNIVNKYGLKAARKHHGDVWKIKGVWLEMLINTNHISAKIVWHNAAVRLDYSYGNWTSKWH